MKKATIAIVTVLSLLVLASFALAGLTSTGLRLTHIDLFDQDFGVLTVINIENDRSAKLEGVKVTVTIPELGFRTASTRFDIGRNKEATRQLLIPLDEPLVEEVWVRIVVSTDEGKRVKHRPLIISQYW